MTNTLPLLFLLLTACNGGGSVEGIDGFGEVRSAVWLNGNTLVLSNQEDYCDQEQAGARLAAETETDREHCEAFLDAAPDIGDAFGSIYEEGAMHLILTLPSGPEEGEYRTKDADGEDVGPTFKGFLIKAHGDPYAWAAEHYDCGDPDPLTEYLADEGIRERQGVYDSRLEIEDVSWRAVDAALEGEIVQYENGESGGDIDAATDVEADGHFIQCESDDYDDIFED